MITDDPKPQFRSLALSLTLLLLTGCHYTVSIKESSAGAEGFLPASISTGTPAILEQTNVTMINRSGHHTLREQGLSEFSYSSRLLGKLKQSQLFPEVTGETSAQKLHGSIRFRLVAREQFDTDPLEVIPGLLILGSAGLLSPFIDLHDYYESELELHAVRWDNATRQYSAKSKGVVSFNQLNTDKENAAIDQLRDDLIANNLNSLMNQMVQDSTFYAKQEPPSTSMAKSDGEKLSSESLSRTAPPTPATRSDVSTSRTDRKHAYAIVIGVEQYRQQLPRATFAVHDAEAVGEYLTKSMGYQEENVIILRNDQAAKSDLEKYLESWLPNHVEKDDTVFIYYSGHGAPNPKNGDAYLVPYDGDPAFVDKTGYALKRLYEQLAILPAKEVIVILDSCFSGAGDRSVIASGTRPIMLSIENPILASRNIAVLAASSGSQISSTYAAQRHGLLTYYFLKGLDGEADQNRDGIIDLAELFTYVKPQVERVARREFNNDQTPQLIGNPVILNNSSHLVERRGP